MCVVDSVAGKGSRGRKRPGNTQRIQGMRSSGSIEVNEGFRYWKICQSVRSAYRTNRTGVAFTSKEERGRDFPVNQVDDPPSLLLSKCALGHSGLAKDQP